ncbi:hypothetical protein ISS08_02005 [Candidatus Pacearchaeota archaeon]|nr:hypothetical protein [Candidatus Pacearchaeota archaeon]
MRTSENPNLNMNGFYVKRETNGRNNIIYPVAFYNKKEWLQQAIEDKKIIFVYGGKVNPEEYSEALNHLSSEASRGVISESDLIEKLTKLTEFTGDQE